MKWLILILVFPMLAWTPVHTDHDKKEKINEEFRSLENDVQSREFRIVDSTPTPNSMRIGEIVIFSSGAVKIFLRVKEDIYSVNASCATIWR